MTQKAHPSAAIHAQNSKGSRTQREHVVSPGIVDYESPLVQALSIISSQLGRPLRQDVLKAGLPQKAQDPTVSQCIRAAEQAGMHARLVRRDLGRISSLVLPCVVLLQEGNAAVVTGIEGERIKAIFPEVPEATQTLPMEEFQKQYTGYAIFCQLTYRADKRASDIKLLETKDWFWGTIKRFWPIYKHVVPASIMVNLLALASPIFIMNVYDRVVPNAALDTLWVLAFGVAVAYGFDFLLRILRGYFVDTAGKNADVLIASKLMQQLLAMRMDHRPESTGTLANNIREYESLREFFSSTTLLALIDLPFIALFIVVIAYIGGPMAIAPAVAVPIVLFVGVVIQQPFQRVVAQSYKENAQKNALIVEAVNSMETIKANMAEGQVQGRWEEAVGMSAVSSAKAKSLSNFSISFSQFAAHFASIGIIVWGVYRIAQGDLTLGGLIACNILVGRAMAPLGAIAAMLTRLQQSRMALKSLDMLMRVPNERSAEKETLAAGELEPSVGFDSLEFEYPGTQIQSLHDVSFHIQAGERVGIIGAMGSGKSTLAKLLMGFYEPQKGSIRLGGIDIRQLDPSELRRRVGYVPQDPRLMYGSVRDNIVLGMPALDDHSVLRAASLAGVLDFVHKHPAGFGIPVGEEGRYLSGGQRQSVALARALVLDPDLLVLDEPTSSMDNRTEAQIKARLQQILPDKTLILITHRRSMLALVDRLVVLDQGRVAADGPKEEILRALQQGALMRPPKTGRTQAD